MNLTNIMLNIRVHILGPDSNNIKFETLIYGVRSQSGAWSEIERGIRRLWEGVLATFYILITLVSS